MICLALKKSLVLPCEENISCLGADGICWPKILAFHVLLMCDSIFVLSESHVRKWIGSLL